VAIKGSDYALFPASPIQLRAVPMWADKDSLLSLKGKTFTCIKTTVRPSFREKALLVIKRAVYRV